MLAWHAGSPGFDPLHHISQMWWCMHVIPMHSGDRWEDQKFKFIRGCMFKASLNYNETKQKILWLFRAIDHVIACPCLMNKGLWKDIIGPEEMFMWGFCCRCYKFNEKEDTVDPLINWVILISYPLFLYSSLPNGFRLWFLGNLWDKALICKVELGSTPTV